MVRALAFWCAIALAWTNVAHADRAEQARFHDELARRYVEQARRTGQRRFLEMALREFLLEQRIAPNPRIVFNIALCFQQLGRNAQAFHYFDEYTASDDDDAARRASAAEAMRTLRPRLALVRVDSDPPGATVAIEGGASTFQSRPANFTLRVAGAHLVEVKTSGDVYAVIYAPESAVNIGGGGQLYGSVIGRSLTVNAHGGIHYDESLAAPGAATTALVQ